MTQDELKSILELHRAWISDPQTGQRADLIRANLIRANLIRANITEANLTRADLIRANLDGADLTGANLTGANLYGANLTGADLTEANLTEADLTGANLTGANLYGADLIRANLNGADLTRANLTGANLYGANLYGANHVSVLSAAQQSIVPEEGQLTGWKKCKNNVLVRLLVGKKAKRSNATSRKCRAEYVKVLEVVGADVGISQHDSKTEYRVGGIVRCDKWEENRWVECGGGIHFFLTRVEAEAY